MRPAAAVLAAACLAMETAAVAPRPRLLCFPGKAETGAGFAQRVERLGSVADLVCVDAPHPLGEGFAWWLLPPGERSFTTPVFEGWDETVAYVRKAWVEKGPFDGMLGFSQGAILIAALAALGVVRSAARDDAPEAGELRPKALMLFGAAVPGPFRPQVAALRGSGSGSAGLRALHVVGAADDVNPPDGGREVAAALGGETWEHPGRHLVPVGDDAIARYEAFLMGKKEALEP
uniref:Serine hydrolase domain-containing protein n=1 Tax=Alexandrium catenella TaxID=2925 RepID=A0A7S1QIV8_ALECA|mmetsp:Transcript_33074/g.89521  ORF Transcript_33074/g.89521 Transcript_33074/m.89521 type:complete len:233 (+) Transcript_33074:40-738(+)